MPEKSKDQQLWWGQTAWSNTPSLGLLRLCIQLTPKRHNTSCPSLSVAVRLNGRSYEAGPCARIFDSLSKNQDTHGRPTRLRETQSLIGNLVPTFLISQSDLGTCHSEAFGVAYLLSPTVSVKVKFVYIYVLYAHIDPPGIYFPINTRSWHILFIVNSPYTRNMSKPILVASVPRACSTAFERVFMTRKDVLKCHHEPFGEPFYYGPERLGSRFDGETSEAKALRDDTGFSHLTYKDIVDQLLSRSPDVGNSSSPETPVIAPKGASRVTAKQPRICSKGVSS